MCGVKGEGQEGGTGVVMAMGRTWAFPIRFSGDGRDTTVVLHVLTRSETRRACACMLAPPLGEDLQDPSHVGMGANMEVL